MGQRQVVSIQEPGFQLAEWMHAQEDLNSTQFDQVNPYRNGLYLNKHVCDIVESYELEFKDKNQFNAFIGNYLGRKEMVGKQGEGETYQTSQYIYHVRYFSNLSKSQMCSDTYKGLLFMDKVDLRLKQVNDIPFQDQVYLYKACLEGFKLLYQKYGIFQIRQEMIFFTKKGKVRVWIHPNLSKFQPNFEPQFYNHHADCHTKGAQAQMIASLINVIQHNSDTHPSTKVMTFRQYLQSLNALNRLTFSKALQYFEAYTAQNQIRVGNFMYSIYLLFNSEEEQMIQISQVSKGINPIQYHYQYQHPYQYTPLSSLRNSHHLSFIQQTPEKEKSSKISCKKSAFKSSSVNKALKNLNQFQSFAPPSQNYREVGPHRRVKSYECFPYQTINNPPFEQRVLNFPQPNRQVQQKEIYHRPQVGIKINTLGSQHDSLIQKLKTPTQQLKTQNKQIIPELKIKSFFQSTDTKQSMPNIQKHQILNKINYYSQNQQYQIDRQIAQDLKQYFNVNLNQF